MWPLILLRGVCFIYRLWLLDHLFNVGLLAFYDLMGVKLKSIDVHGISVG